MSGAVQAAQAAWGGDLPEWVAVLARECQQASGNRVALKLNRSAALVSQVIHRKYPGDLKAVEETVRGVFMAATIECPALGEIASNQCQDWRKGAQNFRPFNPLKTKMFRACRICQNNPDRVDD